MKNEMDIIDDLIARRYHAADGTVPDVVTRAVVIDTNLAGMERDAIRGLGFDTPLALVSDPDTHRVLGQRRMRIWRQQKKLHRQREKPGQLLRLGPGQLTICVNMQRQKTILNVLFSLPLRR